MGIGTIITMTSIGVGTTIGEKILMSFGKTDMASFCNIAGLCGLGVTAVGVVVNLIQTLAQLGQVITMGGTMMAIVKTGTVAYVCQKSLKCFGKKDYADIIAMVGWFSVGVNIVSLFMSMYSAFMNSELIQLVQKIF